MDIEILHSFALNSRKYGTSINLEFLEKRFKVGFLFLSAIISIFICRMQDPMCVLQR